MMKNTFLLLICLSLFIRIQAQKPVYADKTRSIEDRVEDALSKMTLEEKVKLCHGQSKFSVSGVARLGIPEIWMSDGPHGVREEIAWNSWSPAGWTNDSCTAFPALTCLAATFNPNLALRYGQAIGEEARYRKKDVLLGPGINIYRTPLNGRNFEYMGEDPWLTSRMAVPYIQGVQQNGVAACVKHFALNNQETNRDFVNVEISDRALHEIYLPAFKAAVTEGGAWSVMGAYNQLRGQHCCHNELLINTILKKEWGFNGVLISDWGGTHDTRQAAFNGLDIEMGTYPHGTKTEASFGYDDYFLAKPFLTMLQNKEVPISVLNDKVRRILRLNFRTALMSERPLGRSGCEEHSRVARDIAVEGIVLLKNQNSILPVAPGAARKIAVIGENATRRLTLGGGSSELKTRYEISPLQGITDAYGKDVVVYSKGYASGRSDYGRANPSHQNEDSLLNAAVETARQADVVFFIGGLNKNYQQDSEGGDRTTLDLPFGQNKLIAALSKANSRTVVVLLSGNAVSMPWLRDVPGLLQAWYNGSESGAALAAILTGAVNPSGKLPFTFPCKLEDNAAHFFGKTSYPGVDGTQTYQEDLFVGYRWYESRKIQPLFPFGYGLSYTRFTYGKPLIDRKTYAAGDVVKTTLTLTNSGKKDGAEVVQLYVGADHSAVPRPVKELKAFRKVFLKAGETQTVELQVRTADLAYWDAVSGNWKTESGRYTLSIGSSSGDVRGKISFAIQ